MALLLTYLYGFILYYFSFPFSILFLTHFTAGL